MVCRPPARLYGRIPASGARRRAEEGPLWGSDPKDAQRIGSDALMIGSTVASPQAGPLLRVSPILLRVPARYGVMPENAVEWFVEY